MRAGTKRRELDAECADGVEHVDSAERMDSAESMDGMIGYWSSTGSANRARDTDIVRTCVDTDRHDALFLDFSLVFQEPKQSVVRRLQLVLL